MNYTSGSQISCENLDWTGRFFFFFFLELLTNVPHISGQITPYVNHNLMNKMGVRKSQTYNSTGAVIVRWQRTKFWSNLKIEYAGTFFFLVSELRMCADFKSG